MSIIKAQVEETLMGWKNCSLLSELIIKAASLKAFLFKNEAPKGGEIIHNGISLGTLLLADKYILKTMNLNQFHFLLGIQLPRLSSSVSLLASFCNATWCSWIVKCRFRFYFNKITTNILI